MKYECLSCGRRFSEPRIHKERSEYWGSWGYEEVTGCPVCGGGYIPLYEAPDEDEDEEDG